MNSTSEEEGMSRGGRGRRGGASTDVPIAPRDASDGRVSGLVLLQECQKIHVIVHDS